MIGNHQKQALRRGERRAKRSGLQRAVQRPGRAAFALHFDDSGNGAEDVAAAFVFPLVRPFAHGRGRSDRINRDHFAQAIGDRSGGLISIKNFHCLRHGLSLHRMKTVIAGYEMRSCGMGGAYCPRWGRTTSRVYPRLAEKRMCESLRVVFPITILRLADIGRWIGDWMHIPL